MGFFDFLGKLMSGAASNSSTMKNWEENMTLEEIEDLERQGCDMTEYRKKYEAREAAKAARRNRNLEMMDFDKLNIYKATPRALDSEFVKEVAALGKLSKKREAKLVDAKIVYGAVVQAHSDLWEPGTGGPMAAVFVFALDDAHMYDQEWLRKTAENISKMKESVDIPKDSREFIETLRDDQSIFCFKLGESLSEGADAWCVTYAIDKQVNLPDRCLPACRILPLMLLDYPEYNQVADIELIPAKYFTK